MQNYIKVMACKEGDIERGGIFTKGLIDNVETNINMSKVLWVEQYNKVPHKEKEQLYMAVFEGNKHILIYREL